MYKSEPCLHELDSEPGGFEWVDCTDAAASVFTFLRKTATGNERILCAYNFTPIPRQNYRIGVPGPGQWKEIMNTDAGCYWGSNLGNTGGLHAEFLSWHGQPYSIAATLPPLAAVFFKGTI